LLGAIALAWAQDAPVDSFSEGRQSFDQVRTDLLRRYAGARVSENDLYRFAVQGMLAGLNENPAREWNRLYSPEEYRELLTDLSGQVVGIGVEIQFDATSGITEVTGVIPQTPAAREGLLAGDRILEINGKSFRGHSLREVVAGIRGKAGDSVSLLVWRKDQILTKRIRRTTVEWDADRFQALGDGVGMLTIRQFSTATPSMVEKAIDAAKQAAIRALVIDLRGNAGGLLDKAVETIQLFVPAGTPVLVRVGRNEQRERELAKAGPRISGIPIAVLVDKTTACGAEIMASALRGAIGAVIVGEHTFGKGSAQSVEELPNHYAYRFTVAGFETGGGQKIDGVGIEPDLRVAPAAGTSLESLRHVSAPAQRLTADDPLRTAVAVLQLKLRQ
jgi:carboxyl-terminal processing protease